MKLDLKFHGVVVKNKDSSVVPQDQWMVFLAKDNAVPAMLLCYYDECSRLGADAEQLSAVQELMDRVNTWRSKHSELCKVPDVQAGEIQ